MRNMTNLYVVEERINRFAPTTMEKVKKFIRIHIIMVNLQLLQIDMHWNSSTGIRIISIWYENISLQN